MNKTLIVIDKENTNNTIELLEVARSIYVNQPYETYAIGDQETLAIINGYFNHAFIGSTEVMTHPDVRNLVEIIDKLHKMYRFSSLLIPATPMGRMLAPRLAMRLHVGLVADVTGVEHDQGEIHLVRPAFSGKIMACISNLGLSPLMLTVRQNVFSYSSKNKVQTRIIDIESEVIHGQSIKRIKSEIKPFSQDIRDSKVLISGGGGVKKSFDKLEALAEALDGQVSASRSIVDSGVASRNIQVGQSGKTVSPKLYIALGIYGALQHIEGLKNVNHIIAVNKNKDAPICSLSDIVVEGDAVEFIEKLLKKIDDQNES
jgi:electron transfer flavoprotein alpha subunit